MAPGAQKWGLGIPEVSLEKMGKDGKRWWTCDFVHSFYVYIYIYIYTYYIYIWVLRLSAWFIFYSIFIGVVFRQVVIRLSPWLPFWSGFSVFHQWRVYKFPRLVDGSAHMIGRFVSETFKFPWNPKLFVEPIGSMYGIYMLTFGVYWW